MKHIIVTDPDTKPALRFAYDLLARMNMRPHWIRAGVVREGPFIGAKAFCVVRPIEDAEIKDMGLESRNKTIIKGELP